MSNKTIILITFCLTVVITAGLYYSIYSYFYYLEETAISGEIELNTNWSEIRVSDLPAAKDKYFIEIVLRAPFDGGYAKGGIKMPNGDVVNPEIKMFDAAGAEYDFKLCRSRSGRGKARVGYCFADAVKPSGEPAKLMLRTDQKITVDEIAWTGYDYEDLK